MHVRPYMLAGYVA